MEDKVAGMKEEIAGINGKVTSMEDKVAGIEGKVNQMDKKMNSMENTQNQILTLLKAMADKQWNWSKIDEIDYLRQDPEDSQLELATVQTTSLTRIRARTWLRLANLA